MADISRRKLLHAGAVVSGGALSAAALAACDSGASTAAPGSTTTTIPVTNGDEALARLMAGNQRYVDGKTVNEGRDRVRRAEQAQGQKPFAVILNCADSRVSPEIVFDEGVGDLFVVRIAGNTGSEPVVQGSIEYAVEHLGSVLLMVLGHQSCGAVAAALDTVAGTAHLEGHLSAFVDPIIPAAESVQDLPADQRLDAAVETNVRNQVQILSVLPPVLATEVASGHLKVVGAEYHLHTGEVTVLR